MCYTYDVLNRVTARTVKNATTDAVISTETFTYDAAGNITGGSASTTFVYDTNNRLVTYNGNAVSYDLDGNMLSNSSLTCTYDSANRLLTAGGNTYTYNAEDVRIKNVHYGAEEKYTYDTNCKLSKMLTRTVGSTVTKYVYGLGLISEETNNTAKVYHFDYRGSTVAITDVNGNISDTFAYDTYGKVISRVGSSDIIFCYNGRDGVATDTNGLFYMRARYYSPDMRRFINADIIAGEISEAVTLNRYAYANGNPVSFVDPFGLSSRDSDFSAYDIMSESENIVSATGYSIGFISDSKDFAYKYLVDSIQESTKPKRRNKGSWIIQKERQLLAVNNKLGPNSNITKYLDVGGVVLDLASIAIEVGVGIAENVENNEPVQYIISDAIVDAQFSAAGVGIGMAIGSVLPGAGTVVGAVIGLGFGILFEFVYTLATEELEIYEGKSIKEISKETHRNSMDAIWDLFTP